MDFEKVIYENVLKKKKHFTTTYLYTLVKEILKFYEVLFCTYCKDLFCL